MIDLVDTLIGAWDYAFMQRALVAGLITAIMCGVLSCWLVLIGWSLIGDAISHAVLPGVVLSYIFGLPFAVGALVFALLTVWLIQVVRSHSSVLKEDAIIGTIFTPLLALGVVLISVTPSQTDLGHILFGNLLGVTDADLVQVAVLGAITVIAVILKRRDLTLFAFDPTHARAIGLSPARIGALLLTALALAVVAALQAVGIVLVVAMLIIPGVTARLLTNRIWNMLWIAPTSAVIATLVGIAASYLLDTSSGGMIVLAQAAIFAIVYFAGPTGLVRRALRGARRRSDAAAGRAVSEREEAPAEADLVA